MNPSQPQIIRTLQSNNVVVFVAALALGGYAVYSVGDLQTVIYAVCGAYVLRLLLQNPEVLSQLQDQLSLLRHQQQRQPVAHSPHSAHPSHPEMMMPAQAPPPVATQQPRLDLNFMEQTGYQPLRQQQQHQRAQTMPEYDMNNASPTTPIPSYTQFHHHAPPTIKLPNRSSGSSDEFTIHNAATRNRFGSFSQSDNGTITGDRFNLLSAGDITPRPNMDPRMSVVSTFSAFPEPVNNPFGSYAHYDAGTIGGERLVQRVDVPAEYTVPVDFNLSERIAAPPLRPSSSSSVRSNTMPVPAANKKPAHPLRTDTMVIKEEYVPKRQHRKPTVAARVGEVAAPGGGIAPPRTSSAGSNNSSSSPSKRFGSPVADSPQVTSPSGYESDSSHASSSSGHSSKHVSSLNGHGRTESTTSSLGLPQYEKHVRIPSTTCCYLF